MAAATVCENGEYVGVIRATKIAGRSPGWIQRQALIGRIRTQILPGIPTQYNVDDLVRLGKPTAEVQTAGA
jgi:hypothetical protein